LVLGVRINESYFVTDGGEDMPMEKEMSLQKGHWT